MDSPWRTRMSVWRDEDKDDAGEDTPPPVAAATILFQSMRSYKKKWECVCVCVCEKHCH